jgi:uncharacterized membrane protein YebE (DUF533 family)
MAIKIDGTQVQKKSGGGLGSLLGKVLGGAAGFMIGGPAGALTGANIGGGVGGAAGNMIKPGQSNDLSVPVTGAKGPSTPASVEGPSAIDRLNSVMDIGTTVAGGVQSAQKLLGGGANPLGKLTPDTSLDPNKFNRRMTRIS